MRREELHGLLSIACSLHASLHCGSQATPFPTLAKRQSGISSENTLCGFETDRMPWYFAEQNAKRRNRWCWGSSCWWLCWAWAVWGRWRRLLHKVSRGSERSINAGALSFNLPFISKQNPAKTPVPGELVDHYDSNAPLQKLCNNLLKVNPGAGEDLRCTLTTKSAQEPMEYIKYIKI